MIGFIKACSLRSQIRKKKNKIKSLLYEFMENKNKLKPEEFKILQHDVAILNGEIDKLEKRLEVL